MPWYTSQKAEISVGAVQEGGASSTETEGTVTLLVETQAMGLHQCTQHAWRGGRAMWIVGPQGRARSSAWWTCQVPVQAADTGTAPSEMQLSPFPINSSCRLLGRGSKGTLSLEET